MEKSTLFRFCAIVITVCLFLAEVLSEPIAEQNRNDFLERYLAKSRRQNSISSLVPSSEVQRTHSAKLTDLEERLISLESQFQIIQENNIELEKKLSGQRDLNRQQEELVSTLKRIVGPVSPDNGMGAGGGDALPHSPDNQERGMPTNESSSSAPVETGQETDQEGDSHRPDQRSSKSPVEELLEANEYLGNLEAHLVQLNPDGDELVRAAAEDFDRVSSNPSLYGKALLHLEDQNDQLKDILEKALEDFEEFKGQMIALLQGKDNQTSSVSEVSSSGMDTQGVEGRATFLDGILRDVVSPSRDDDSEVDSGKVSGKCGFSVAASVSQMGVQGTAQIVNFDYVFVNKGDNFNMKNSSFVCDVPGYYFFTYSIRSFDNRYVGVMLMKNEEPQVTISTDSSQRSVTESQSVFIQLVKGDVVWLRLSPSSKYGLYSDQYHSTTFSGFQIYKGD